MHPMAPHARYRCQKKDAYWDGASGANCNAQPEHWRSNKSGPKKSKWDGDPKKEESGGRRRESESASGASTYHSWNGLSKAGPSTDSSAGSLWGGACVNHCSPGVFENAYGVPLCLDTDAPGKNRGSHGIRTAKTSHLRLRSNPK